MSKTKETNEQRARRLAMHQAVRELEVSGLDEFEQAERFAALFPEEMEAAARSAREVLEEVKVAYEARKRMGANVLRLDRVPLNN